MRATSDEVQNLICKKCNANTGYLILRHNGGDCGIVNTEKDFENLHDHFYCRQCGCDHVLKELVLNENNKIRRGNSLTSDTARIGMLPVLRSGE